MTTKGYNISNFPKFETGCKLHVDCFTCPFPDCLEGTRIHGASAKNKEEAQALSRQGFDVTRIAENLGKTKRTIQRYLNAH